MLFEILFHFVRYVFDNQIFGSTDERVEFLQTTIIDVPFPGRRRKDIVIYCLSCILGICFDICTDLQVEL